MNELLTAWEEVSQAVLSTEQIRDIDRLAVEEYGMHSLVLMENAAIGCVQWLRQNFAAPQKTLILCGRGNNGGDGLAIARHLLNCGWPCQVVVQGPVDQLSSDARSNYRILCAQGGPEVVVWQDGSNALPDLADFQLVLDAMLGTGAKGDPRPPLDHWIQAVNRLRCYRVAIDIPTGVNAETGECGHPTFAADATLSFVARKPAMSREDIATRFGTLVVLPIGVPAQLLLRVLKKQR